jgi:acetyl esterase/lipase
MIKLKLNKLEFIVIFVLLVLASCRDRPKYKLFPNLIYNTYTHNNKTEPLLLDLYLPKTKSSQPLPLLIYIHGGGWWSNSKAECPREMITNRGYALACVNYRLSDVALFPAQIKDVKNAVRWLRKNASEYNIDPNKIGVWGSSAGGHLSLLLGTSAGVKELTDNNQNRDISDAVQAVGDWFAPTDFTKFTPTFSTSIITPDIEKKYRKQLWYHYTVAVVKLLGGTIVQKRTLAQSANPINYIDKNDPPVFIIHGNLDRVVPISQSEIMTQALQTKGVPVEFISIADMNHSFEGKNGERFDPKLIDMTVDFFDKHLK